MKTILLLTGALLLAAAVFVRTSVHSQSAPGPVPSTDPIRSEDFTVSLKGYWWTHATEKERQIYLLAYGAGARVSISAEAKICYDTRSELKMRVKDVFDSRFACQIQRSCQRSCREVGASPVASVFYRLASDPYWGVRCAA